MYESLQPSLADTVMARTTLRGSYVGSSLVVGGRESYNQLVRVWRSVCGELCAVGAIAAGLGRCRPCPLPQACVYLREVWTSHRRLVPTLHHHRVHARRTVLRTGQELAAPDHVDHLLVTVSVVRLEMKSTPCLFTKILSLKQT